ncbi:hypothetical protein FRC09_020505 [Ceratobasidium sp. 395]|nr:hypothetical protein FRC09_020505 [Ceratobasidium sp. 395]
MPQVKSGSTILADSDKTVVVEGNHYFPPDSIKKEYFKDSDTQTYVQLNSSRLVSLSDQKTRSCYWKGIASYYNVEVEGKSITDAAWYYPEPKDKAAHLKDWVAFYKTKVSVGE